MFIEKKDDVVSIGNSFLERKFNVSDNKLLPMAVINKRTEEEISFEPKKGSEEFVISILTHKNKKENVISNTLDVACFALFALSLCLPSGYSYGSAAIAFLTLIGCA
ncbi:MAG: hypothetical protein RR355_00965, partial [Oscillospiraceae bacterium]